MRLMCKLNILRADSWPTLNGGGFPTIFDDESQQYEWSLLSPSALQIQAETDNILSLLVDIIKYKVGLMFPL